MGTPASKLPMPPSAPAELSDMAAACATCGSIGMPPIPIPIPCCA
eukprot:CAMPEP_0185316358 /NCGR_PEP_ID=MMETSP1363-20130426/43919_1 /TAXON_ID=38817 /ORGANISM="Gephyrocapsa oceanica, Strain RCC1303" /LENGTH=44 /DNA_ID=CAMNT_0027914535 /DNA_START=37 /DNA_END=167 /DNA_ORIENTATION=+